MIDITPKALAQIKTILKQEGKQDYGLRIGIENGGCCGFRYFMELQKSPQSEDHVLELDGVKFFIDPTSIPYLQGSEIDYTEDVYGAGFIFRNPNEHRECQCGHHHSDS